MADNTLSILVQLNDQASAKLTAFDEKLKGMGTSLKDLSTKAVAFGAAITASLGMMVNAAQEDEEAENRLKNAVENTGVAYDTVREQIEALTMAQMRNTSFSQDEQIAALNELVVVTGSYEQAIATLPLALDLAAQADIDLSTASRMLGKVNEGVVTQLRQYGIILSENAIAAAEAGDSSLALAEIEAKVGGAAEATVNPFTVLKNELGELASRIGASLLPVLQKIIDFVVPIIETIIEWVDENQTLVTVLTVVAGVIGTVAGALGTLGLILPSIITGIKLLRTAQIALNIAMHANPIGLVCLAIEALIAIVAIIIMKWDQVKEGFKKCWDFIKEHWELIGMILLGPLGGAIGFIISHWEQIKEGFRAVVDWIKEKWDAVWEGAKNAFKGFVNFFIGLAEGFANIWVHAINWVIDCINRISFTVPSWVPFVGGNTVGFNIGHVAEVHLARLEKGGTLTSSGAVMVGERGPEIVTLPAAASVVPLGAGGGSIGDVYVTVNVEGSMFSSTRELVSALTPAIREEMLRMSRRLGGTPSGALGLG